MCVKVRMERVQRLPHGAKMLVDQPLHGPIVVWVDASVPADQAAIWAEQALSEFSGSE